MRGPGPQAKPGRLTATYSRTPTAATSWLQCHWPSDWTTSPCRNAPFHTTTRAPPVLQRREPVPVADRLLRWLAAGWRVRAHQDADPAVEGFAQVAGCSSCLDEAEPGVQCEGGAVAGAGEEPRCLVALPHPG